MRASESETKEKLYALKLLRVLSEVYPTATALADELDTYSENISKYLRGHTLPTRSRKDAILNLAFSQTHGINWRSHLRAFVQIKIEKSGLFFVDWTHLENNSQLLEALAFTYSRQLLSTFNYNKIIACPDSSIFPYIIASINNLPCIYGSYNPPPLSNKYHSQKITRVNPMRGNGQLEYEELGHLFINDPSIIGGDRVVLVCNHIRTGATIKAMLKLIQKLHGSTSGILALFGTDKLARKKSIDGVPLQIIYPLMK